ncbi:hypothetical protein [Desulforhopalus singaporensis]|uniref:Uncharacterized protein n=1 Tax=Desulforhopalus singaporensis TaxID=91360 RepID=A0A1H0TLP7_9BACT|nr:hypothetical protein [Desulforhopalus singaporensis]SDP54954.1 hypothetical protein SAMN05660330_03148 [Desulforhopalus singaporensis]
MFEETVIGAFFGIVLYLIGGARGANKVFWLVMGVVFGPFALPFVFFANTDKAGLSADLKKEEKR